MNRQQITDLLAMHEQAIQYLSQIANAKEAILRCQNNMVDIEKSPLLPRSNKDLFIAQYQETIQEWRECHSRYVARYADTMRELVEPYLPIAEDNGATYLVTSYELVKA